MESMEQPEVIQESSESTDAVETKGGAPEPQIVDLDSVQKFKWQGREMTLDDLKKGYMAQSDYTKKTQQIAQERKYFDNLSADLELVRSNPSLAGKFKELYPEKYHSYLKHVLQEQSDQNEHTGIPKEFLQKFERLDKMEQYLLQKETEATMTKLDATFSNLSSKYPYADENTVVAYAQALLDKNENVDDQVLERLFKKVHDNIQSRVDSIHKETINKQRMASRKGADVPAGGGTPTHAPNPPKNIKEATEAVRRAIAAGQF